MGSSKRSFIVRRVLPLLRHMEESGGSTPSTYVTPKRRRKPGATDFTNRRARKRRGSRRKVDLKGNLLSAPLKGRGARLPLALKFCSICKLILEYIVEIKEEVLEAIVVEYQQHEVINSEGKQKEMKDGLGFNSS